ncbi:MAG TPA: SRPBCC domain-containing protein [Terracidiphilus sp.]|nr:SRPBCC domain-containing protein [Terracidiphilus sp.]
MADPTIVHSSFVIERSYPQPVSSVYAAFAQPARKRRWYAEGDHEIQEFEMEFRNGGSERFSYRFKAGHPLAGSAISNEGSYQDITPDKRIIMTSKMTLNGKPIQIMLATFEFVAAGSGTELVLTHQGVYMDWPGGAEMIEAGWRSLLERLGKALEQES